MLLSSITLKQISTPKNVCGVCKGIAFSLSSGVVKYILCDSQTNAKKEKTAVDFCLPFSSMERVDELSISIKKPRPVLPKPYARIFIGLPVFTELGHLKGVVTDLQCTLMENGNFIATTLFVDGNPLPIKSVTAINDAVILRKQKRYPLGQRIPVGQVYPKAKQNFVTKSVLQTAIKNSSLIKFTLSLPPFNVAT